VGAEPELLAVVEVRDGTSGDDVLAVVDAVNAAQAVPYQRITGVYAVSRRMCIENGQLTASLKVSSGQVLAAFRRWRHDGGAQFVCYRD